MFKHKPVELAVMMIVFWLIGIEIAEACDCVKECVKFFNVNNQWDLG